MPPVDREALAKACQNLGDVVQDPAAWPRVMEGFCRAANSQGAILLQTDNRTPDIPFTTGAEDMATTYFRDGWYLHDIRAARGVPLLLAGASVIVDQDLFPGPGEMAREPLYAEVLPKLGLQWFAAIHFRSGLAHWGFSIQRTPREGAFSEADKQSLGKLSEQLSAAATLSHLVGRTALASTIDALNAVEVPTIAVDRLGAVLGANTRALDLLDEDFGLRFNRLWARDRQAQKAINSLFEFLALVSDYQAPMADPIVVRREKSADLVLKMLPVHPAARSPFLGARALITITPLIPKRSSASSTLKIAFNLTPAEIRLANALTNGSSLEQAAETLGIARETARNQLKAIFAKTDTHRQGQLVALLARL